MTTSDQRACPLCNSPSRSPIHKYSVEPWQIAACDDCGFVYLANPPAYDRLVSEFAWEKTSAAQTERRRKRSPVVAGLDRTTRWRLGRSEPREHRLFSRVFAPGNVLDVGCAGGNALPDRFVPYGIEISEALHRQAAVGMAARGGRAVHAAAAIGIREFGDGFFTGVVMRSVLEHEMQPAILLAEARRVLADGGAVFIRVPNFGSLNRRVVGPKWCGFRYPDHVNYFTRTTLTRMARAAGFTLRLLNWATLPTDDNIKAVLLKA